jgi:two-component system sensor histidine kinase KdpD
MIALATGIVAMVRVVADVDNTSMIYLLAVLASALAFGSRAAIVTAVTSLVAFNFFFVEPKHTFTVAHEGDWVGLVLLLITGVITGQLAAELRTRARRAEQREKEAAVLYDVVRLLSEPAVPDSLQRLAERLRSELGLVAVAVSLGEPLNLRAFAGDPAALDSAGMPIRLTSGTPPTATAPARPGRWVRIVNPAKRRGAGENVRVVVVRAGEEQAGSISVVPAFGAEGLTSIGDRLLSAVAHQLGQTMVRLRLQREALDAEVLRRTDEVRSALLNAVSHDLRTPLSAIIATGGNMLSDVPISEEDRKTSLQLILAEALRLDGLVGGLLDLSRIEAGALVPNKALHDLPGLLNEVSGRIETAFPFLSITIETPGDLPPIAFDYVEIQQVLTNLLENAARHSSGAVSVSMSSHAGEIQVAIEDTGPGIPPAELPALFQPFATRGKPGDRSSGTGLGLAIAHGFVTAHGGRIWAENTSQGARFVFTLPAAPGQTVTTAA